LFLLQIQQKNLILTTKLESQSNAQGLQHSSKEEICKMQQTFKLVLMCKKIPTSFCVVVKTNTQTSEAIKN
jgi:hypothetical protein